MTTIRIADVSKAYGPTRVIDRVSLTIAPGELFFLLGPSGCGKTTLLRMLAGFVEPESGDIYFDDKPQKGVPPRLRNTGMVFQNYALWPHRSVASNIAYGLEVRGLARADIRDKVAQALRLVRLEGLGERRPAQLSGGQQQRVALARALVIQPQVLLLDEPLSNLDARLRLEMREEIRRIHAETKLTMVYVTHDQKEALSLADRIAILSVGRVAQIGTAADVYNRPASRFVADFVGDCNFVEGSVVEAGANGSCVVQTPLGRLRGTATATTPAGGSAVTLGLRPEALRIASAPADGNSFPATVERVAFQGEVLNVHLTAAGSVSLIALALQSAGTAWQPGQSVLVHVPLEQTMVLNDG
jgi:ABC-type Fe3+/spermidine/putrescine transport system ATPase subunit